MARPAASLHIDDRVLQPQGEVLRDYILTEYPPVASMTGRLHSSSMLRHFLRHAGLTVLWPVIARAPECLGPGQTVWGVKLGAEGQPLVELYFYNHQGNRPGNPKSITRLVECFAPTLRIDSRIDESIDYFMVSLELDAEIARTGHSEGLRMYVNGTRAKHGYDGISYLVTADELRRENYYNFYRAETELEQVREQLRRSVRSGDGASQQRLLSAELCDCYTICFATKRSSDALYFSRITTAQLRPFAEAHLPGPVSQLLATESEAFAHLRWDVGLDFTAASTAPGHARIVKAGLYGFL